MSSDDYKIYRNYTTIFKLLRVVYKKAHANAKAGLSSVCLGESVIPPLYLREKQFLWNIKKIMFALLFVYSLQVTFHYVVLFLIKL